MSQILNFNGFIEEDKVGRSPELHRGLTNMQLK